MADAWTDTSKGCRRLELLSKWADMSKTTNSFAPEGRARAVRMVGCTEAWRDTALKLHPPCREGITMALKHAAAGEVFHITGIDDPAAQTVALARTSPLEAVNLFFRAGGEVPAPTVD